MRVLNAVVHLFTFLKTILFIAVAHIEINEHSLPDANEYIEIVSNDLKFVLPNEVDDGYCAIIRGAEVEAGISGTVLKTLIG